MMTKSIKLKIDFKPERENPQDILVAAIEAIEAVIILDTTIIRSLTIGISSKLLLQDFERGSLVIKLMQYLEEPEQGTLGNSINRQQIEEYVDRSRDAAISTLNIESKNVTSKEIHNFIAETEKISSEIGINDTITKVPPNIIEIANGLSKLSHASKKLDADESLLVTVDQGPTGEEKYFRIPKDAKVDMAEIENSLTAKTIEHTNLAILVIKKPDFLGDSQWEFKRGKETLYIKIGHEEWLSNFKKGSIILVPGDSLEVDLHEIFQHDKYGRLISQKREIVYVHRILKLPINE